jgi:hypothetical protein
MRLGLDRGLTERVGQKATGQPSARPRGATRRQRALPLALVPVAITFAAKPAGAQDAAGPAPAPAAADGPIGPGEGCVIGVQTGETNAQISVDGEPRGRESFEGVFVPGRHTLRVELSGYEPFESALTCRAGDVHSEAVRLEPSVALQAANAPTAAPRAADGLYGGLQLLGAFEPSGSGSTLAEACDTTGATRCSAGSVLGGGISGYVGWMVEPLGLELALLTAADVTDPDAHFDGVTGSEINPNLAAPARTESFTIARFGGGAALRARVSRTIDRFRFSAALGPGLAYRYLLMKRDTVADGGRVGAVSDTGTGYVSALLSLELSAQLLLGESTALSLGVVSWLEHAGDDARSQPRRQAVLIGDDGPPVPQATPAYDMASGTQWFVGPFLGLAFGA